MAGLEQDQHRPRLKIIASVSRHDGSAQTGFTFLDSVQSSTVKRCVDRVGKIAEKFGFMVKQESTQYLLHEK